LFDTRDLIKRTVSASRETLNTTLMLLLVTVNSFELSGTADVKSHSSSSFTALVLLCARLEDGGGTPTPRRSTAPDNGCGGLIDCWNWNGEAWRGVDEANAANGSGVDRADGLGAGCEYGIGGGDDICAGSPDFDAPPNRSLIDDKEDGIWVFGCGTETPDKPRTEEELVW
jgi:hypothetical protein